MGKVINGDALETLKTLAAESVQCVVTSPPYWRMRDYGFDGQIGLEETLEEYLQNITAVFSEVKRVLRKDGTLWLNIGDGYFGDSPVRKMSEEAFSPEWDPKQTRSRGGLRRSARKEGALKPKDLILLPARVALALQADGWWIRSDNIWSKPNPMPDSAKDRPTRSHEYLYLLAKARHYYYDAAAIMEKAVSGNEARWDNGEGGHCGGISHAGQGSSTRKFRTPLPANWDTEPGDHGKFIQDGHRRVGPNSREVVDRVPRSRKPHPERSKSSAGERFGRFPGWRNCEVAKVAPPHKRSEWEHLRSDPGVEYVAVMMRNKRTVWEIATNPYPDAHFATFPENLVRPCILAGTKPGQVVLDPFAGSGTTLAVAVQLGRDYIGIEGKKEYIQLIEKRLAGTTQGMAI